MSDAVSETSLERVLKSTSKESRVCLLSAGSDLISAVPRSAGAVGASDAQTSRRGRTIVSVADDPDGTTLLALSTARQPARGIPDVV